MIEMLSYPFLLRAFIVGLLVSLTAALLGVSLVLRRFSMIGDGLSHVGFGALAISSVLGFSPMGFTIPVVVVSAIILLRISDKSKISSESMIALISSSALAIGVVAVSYVRGTNTDINNFLFGSLLAVSKSDALFSVILSALTLICYILLYPRLYAITFDPAFARSAGMHIERYSLLLAVLSALTVTLGMRMLGSLLISALIIFPPLSAMRVFKRYKSVCIASALISVVAFIIGMYLSYALGLPVGASIVCVNLLIFLLLSFTRVVLKIE